VTIDTIDNKVTELAKDALKKNEGWLAVVMLLLWGWWLSWQLARVTGELQKLKLEASQKHLDALELEQRTLVAGIQANIEAASAATQVAAKELREVAQRVAGERAAASVVKERIARMTTWEELDALAQGE